MVSDVKALHSHLRIPVDCCENCPLAYLHSIGLGGFDQDWRCAGTPERRALGGSRPDSSAPEWCPLKVQPFVIHWESPRKVGRQIRPTPPTDTEPKPVEGEQGKDGEHG